MVNNQEIVSGITQMMIPFRLSDRTYSDLISVISPLTNPCKKLVDSTLYYTHIQELIHSVGSNDGLESKVPFLHVHRLNKQKLSVADNTLDQCVFTLNEENLSCDFRIAEIDIVLNAKKTYQDLITGFIVIQLEWLNEVQPGAVFDLLASSDFFRFHEIKNLKKRKNICFKLKGSNNMIQIGKDILMPSLSKFMEIIEISGKRPYLLHFLTGNSSDEALRVKAYRTLRNPPASQVEINEQRIDTLMESNVLGVDLSSHMMSEGAVLLSQAFKMDRINRYFPSFLLALNQREIQIYLSERFNLLTINGEGKYLPSELRRTEGNFIKVRFDQFFKSVSSNTEVNAFFNGLQMVFGVEELLKDNEHKILSLKQLVLSSQESDQEELEKRREKKINILLIVITVFSLFSAVDDTYDLFGIKETVSPHFVWIPVLSAIVLAAYLMKGDSKDTMVDK